MTYANVVPIRRMPADRPWLTYKIPEGMTVTPGMLVTVPLRNTAIQGIVWNLPTKVDIQFQLQEIRSVVVPHLVVSPWQQRVCDLLADTGSTSLGDVLFRVIPKLSISRLKKLLPEATSQPAKPTAVPDDSFLWYRSRQEALEKIAGLVRLHAKESTVIITPTIDDAQQVVALTERHGRVAFHNHGQLSPTEYVGWYTRILRGEPLVVIGGVSSLALPFLSAPIVVLDQEEHHAHKQSAQYPYYDARLVCQQLSIPSHLTTPAPSLNLYHQTHPDVPPASGRRHLISLHGPKQGPMVSEELFTIIDEAQAAHKQVLCISPRRGFSSYTACRACGQALNCPSCGRVAALFHGVADEARCQSCKTTVPLTVTCKHCGSTAWSFHGLGVEQSVSVLKKLRPDLIISPVIRPDIAADVSVDTYQAYRQVSQIQNVGAVIVISGDSLLSLPDYSVAERAWQYLARLQSVCDPAKLIIQTWEPESLFWQRWLHGDDRAWYDNEITERQRIKVPPFVRQWIVSVRGPQEIAAAKLTDLSREFPTHLEVQLLPPRPSKPNVQRLLMTFRDEQDQKYVDWKTQFPLPWHVDRYPTSWLD